MSSFIDVRLLEDIGYGTQVILSNKILRKPVRSGIIRRRGLRRSARQYTILVKKLIPRDNRSVANAFIVCSDGESFRLRDQTDYAVDNQILTVGTGAEQTIQLFKLYEFGIASRQRPIRKPVAGTVTLSAPTPPTGVSIDYTTGMATFTATAAEVVRFSCEFDVPVMFADDSLAMSAVAQAEDGQMFLTTDVTLVEDLAA